MRVVEGVWRVVVELLELANKDDTVRDSNEVVFSSLSFVAFHFV